MFYTANKLIWAIFLVIVPITALVTTSNSIFLIEWELYYITTPIIFNIISDKTGILFSCVVLFIRANVLSFSSIYISHDKSKDRFTILVLLFILSINLLIFIPHIIILLLGWDGLGLVSFILVIYYQNSSSLAASLITALTNRIGDVTILLAIAFSLNQAHWLVLNIHSHTYLYTQIILITCAAMTKRAQIPFSRWLPAAIAAPTPVSALVHSSTLVTAGVFLLIRFYPSLHLHPLFNNFILIVATSTTLMAGIRATTECDFKKIVALSTLRQLGVIIFRIGANIPWLAFFHIVTHAIFKALLFICVGSFIHFHSHSQDLRWIGNISRQLPTIISCLTIANLALCGFPFIAGFYSKDIVVESAISYRLNTPLILLTIISLGLTSFYTIRATTTPIISPNSHAPYITLSEPSNLTNPTILLSAIAIIGGSSLRWTYPIRSIYFTVPLMLKLVPLLCIILGAYLGWTLSSSPLLKPSNLIKLPIVHEASAKIWFLVPLSTQFIFKAPIYVTLNSLKSIDHGWMELSSSQGIFKFIYSITNNLIKNSPKTPNQFILLPTSIILVLVLIKQ